jgi:16S rRNA processing protein RimM
LTVRVFRGEAARWSGVPRVRVESTGDRGSGRSYDVEASRAYRDRLVLKLAGIDDPGVAAGLRGSVVSVREDLAPALAGGKYHPEVLIGFEVLDLTTGDSVGEVREVMPTAGADLLVIVSRPDASRDEEILVPWVDEIVVAIDLEGRRIEIRPPEALLELNRR